MRFELTVDFRPSLVFKTSSLNHSDNSPNKAIAVFEGNGKTLFYSGGVSSTLDSLRTIIGNFLHIVEYCSPYRNLELLDGLEPPTY